MAYNKHLYVYNLLLTYETMNSKAFILIMFLNSVKATMLYDAVCLKKLHNIYDNQLVRQEALPCQKIGSTVEFCNK